MNDSAKLSDLFLSRQALIVFVTALALRLVFLIEFSASPLFSTPTMDMLYHQQWATAIAAGQTFIEGPFFRAPLYAYFLGAIYFLFGKSFWVAPIVQVILGSISAVLTMAIGTLAFSMRVGFIAGIIVAVCGTLIFYDAQLLVTPLAVFLNVLAIFLLLMALKGEGISYYSLSGLVFGLSAIARPTILLFVLIVALWLIWRTVRSDESFSIVKTMAFAIAVLLPIAPVTIYNYQQSGEFALIGTYSGMNFYIGNNAQSDGVSARLPGARGDWFGMMTDARLMAHGDVGHELTDSELSDYWNRKTWEEIANDPARFVSHLNRKLLILIQGVEISNNLDFYYFARQSLLLKILIWPKGVFFPWGILLPFAIGGILLARFKDHYQKILGLFLIGYVPAIVLFFVTTRYRQPLIPVLAIFAALLIATLWDNLKDRSPRSTVAAIIATIIFLFASNIDTFGHGNRTDAPGLYMMGQLSQKNGERGDAERYFREAIKADSTFAQSYNELALILGNRGEFQVAESLMVVGLRHDSLNGFLHYNLGYTLLNMGENARAIRSLKRSLELRLFGNAFDNLGVAMQRLNVSDTTRRAQLGSSYIYPYLFSAIADHAHYLNNPQLYHIPIRFFTEAINQQGRNVGTIFFKGLVWIDENEPDSARAEFEGLLDKWRVPETDSLYIQTLIDSLRNVHE